MFDSVPTLHHRSRRGKRPIVPQAAKAVLEPDDLRRHAEIIADGKPRSGRCGQFVYYMFKGRLRWRRYVVPRDPRTLAQQLARAAFGAMSRTWSESNRLTEEQRDDWYTEAAKVQSHPRLGLSGPLTGQQFFMSLNCRKEQLGLGMLLEPLKQGVKNAGAKKHNAELTPQIEQSQPVTQASSGTRRPCAVVPPSQHRKAPRRARNSTGNEITSQVMRSQRLTQASSECPRSACQSAAGARPVAGGWFQECTQPCRSPTFVDIRQIPPQRSLP